ncbi:MAG: hypothetical protein ABSF95_19395 [Verrucomicrobiota bacterium]|jgi:hypothetical protein
MNSILKTGAFGLLAVALAGLPVRLPAQTNEIPAVVRKSAGEKKQAAARRQAAGPFHGKLAAVDKVNKTITVGKRTFQVTSETKIAQGGKPALLEDGVVGGLVSGGFKTAEDGKLIATKVNLGPKVAAKKAQTKAQPKE